MTANKTKLAKKESKRNQLKNHIRTGVASLLQVIESDNREMLGVAKAIILRYSDDSMNTIRRLKEIVEEIHCMNKGQKVPLHIPQWPSLSEGLSEDVTAHIFSFLDEVSINVASKVSRTFHEALLPRERQFCLRGFQSFEVFELKNYVGI